MTIFLCKKCAPKEVEILTIPALRPCEKCREKKDDELFVYRDKDAAKALEERE